jgi:membrane associated rhomboid family serine protease
MLQLIGGLVSHSGDGGVAFWAHVGGFAAGAALIPLFRRPEFVARHPCHGWHPRAPGARSWRRIR